jgi:hypothetical protein
MRCSSAEGLYKVYENIRDVMLITFELCLFLAYLVSARCKGRLYRVHLTISCAIIGLETSYLFILGAVQ